MNSMKRIAVYAGTFDPPTRGHTWMIEEAAGLFDELVVAIGINPDKKTSFTLEERHEMLKKITKHLPTVRVTSFVNQYLVNYASSIKAETIVRGIRNVSDYEYEKAMRNINSDLDAPVRSVFLMPPREIGEISSSAVKGLMGPEGWEQLVATYVPHEVLVKLIASRHTLWRNLQGHGAKGNEREFWNNLLTPYLHPKRAYHNLLHIANMLTLFEKVKHLTEAPVAVEMAIWFHDAVFDSMATDNEERSADLGITVCKELGLDEEFGQKVAELILATKHSVAPTNPDAKTLVDLDLSILGAPETRFDNYEIGIRKEYSWVPEEVFRKKRTDILKMFFERRPLFLTTFFQSHFEHTARENLARSIKKLAR